MSATQQAGNATRTYRARSLDELIPRIKEELGADAVITRRREGLAGGIGGFFQRSFVEVEARAAGAAAGAALEGGEAAGAGEPPAQPDVAPGGPRLDVYDDDAPATPPPYGAAADDGVAGDLDFDAVAGEPAPAGDDQAEAEERSRLAAAGLDPATIEGLTSPAIRALVGQAAPFVDRAAAASGSPEPAPGALPAPTPASAAGSAFARQLDLAHARERDHVDEGSQGPEVPEAAEPEPLAAEPEPFAAERPNLHSKPAESAEPAEPAEPAARSRGRPPSSGSVERSMREAGLSAELAGEIVAETVSHLLPFGSPRGLKRLARTALAHRIPVQGTLTGARTAAFVGPGGAGKTLCAARLAAAYAAGSDLSVACLTLDAEEGAERLARLLDEVDVEVRRFEDATGAAAWLGDVRRDALVVIDTPAVSPGDEGAVRHLARRLRGLSPTEVHLVVPATVSAAAARDLVTGLRPLGPTSLALSHADETAHLGAVVEVAVETPLPVSYLSRGTAIGAGFEPADASALAALVLP